MINRNEKFQNKIEKIENIRNRSIAITKDEYEKEEKKKNNVLEKQKKIFLLFSAIMLISSEVFASSSSSGATTLLSNTYVKIFIILVGVLVIYGIISLVSTDREEKERLAVEKRTKKREARVAKAKANFLGKTEVDDNVESQNIGEQINNNLNIQEQKNKEQMQEMQQMQEKLEEQVSNETKEIENASDFQNMMNQNLSKNKSKKQKIELQPQQPELEPKLSTQENFEKENLKKENELRFNDFNNREYSENTLSNELKDLKVNPNGEEKQLGKDLQKNNNNINNFSEIDKVLEDEKQNELKNNLQNDLKNNQQNIFSINLAPEAEEVEKIDNKQENKQNEQKNQLNFDEIYNKVQEVEDTAEQAIKDSEKLLHEINSNPEYAERNEKLNDLQSRLQMTNFKLNDETENKNNNQNKHKNNQENKQQNKQQNKNVNEEIQKNIEAKARETKKELESETLTVAETEKTKTKEENDLEEKEEKLTDIFLENASKNLKDK